MTHDGRESEDDFGTGKSSGPVTRNTILQPWVETLGLRHQGVLLTAVRGCDTSPKESPVKAVTRCFRHAVLNAFVGDAKKAKTFIEAVEPEELNRRLMAVAADHDALPHHYLMHLVQAAEVVGYKHPDRLVGGCWLTFYLKMARKFHMTAETEAQMDARLTADENTFYKNQ